MEVGKLHVQRRHDTGKGIARKLRSRGLIPGICYGVAMEGTLAITVDPKALRGSLDPGKGENTLIDCSVDDNGQSQNVTVMLRDYQVDPIRRELTHVDLVAIDPNAKLQVEVPVELTGRSKGVVNGGGLHVVAHAIEVICRPADIPTRFTLDITELDIGDNRHINDLEFPEGVEPVNDVLTIVTCTAPDVEIVAPEEGLEGEEEEAEGGEAAGDEGGEGEQSSEE